MTVTLRTCRTQRTCRHCKHTINKGDRFYDHNSRPDEAVCARCEHAKPVGYLDWLAEQGYPSRADVPITRRCEMFDRWFRWRCKIGHPPDKMGGGGSQAENTGTYIPPTLAPARISGLAHRQREGWSSGLEKVG